MKAPTITYPQSIVQSYITEPNILRESKEPRSEHVLKGLIEEIQEAPIPYPTDVINRLFAKDDLPALVNHASDLEQDSEVDDIIGGVSASDFFELEERATYAGFTVHKVKTDRSLFRAVALVVFESEDLYNDIINEVINYVNLIHNIGIQS